MVRTIRSELLPVQGALLYVIMVRFTVPAAASAALGMYVGLIVLEFRNVPVPEVIHRMDAKLVAVAPVTVKLAPEQIVASGPAFATENLTIDSTIASTIVLLQGGYPMAVSVSVTEPLAISTAFGV